MHGVNVPKLASAIVAHARRQHEDSKWAIVVEGMTYSEVRGVVEVSRARTARAAIRAMDEHLDSLLVLV